MTVDYSIEQLDEVAEEVKAATDSLNTVMLVAWRHGLDILVEPDEQPPTMAQQGREREPCPRLKIRVYKEL